MKELIVSEIKGDKIVKNGVTLDVEPCCAYLVPNEDGTHERYVSDENSVLSKQGKEAINIQDVNLLQSTLDSKANKTAENLDGSAVEKWREKLRVEDIPEVEFSTETSIKFDRDRDYGKTNAPLTTFTIDKSDAKRGVVNVIWYNAQELPSISGVDYGHSQYLFRRGVTCKIVMMYVDDSTIIANIIL